MVTLSRSINLNLFIHFFKTPIYLFTIIIDKTCLQIHVIFIHLLDPLSVITIKLRLKLQKTKTGTDREIAYGAWSVLLFLKKGSRLQDRG